MLLAFRLSLLASALAAAACLAVPMVAGRCEVPVRRALLLSVLGVLPGLVFVVHALVNASSSHPEWPYNLASTGLAVLWIPIAFGLFVVSVVFARPGKVRWYAEALRTLLFVGWIASSWLAILAAAEV